MASIFAPVLYLVIIIGGLGIFSSFYRKRIRNKPLEPYFASHPERDLYVSLLQQTDPPAHDALIRAALIRRAMADVQRILRLREDKPAAQALLQKGVIGDDLWQSILAAEKEVEAELLEVMHEANSFVQGWGQFIFNTAGEMVQNEKTRKLVVDDYGKLKAEIAQKYGGKQKSTDTSVPSTPAKIERPSTPLPTTESSTPEKPKTPLSASTSNGSSLLSPNVGTDGDDVISMSEGESVSAPSTPGKPSKKSAKKNKKRK